MTTNPNPRAPRKPPFTTDQVKRLGELLECNLVAPAALKAVGISEQQLRETGFTGVLNSQNLVAWLSAKTVDHDVRLGITEQTATKAAARAENVAERLAAYMERTELNLDALRVALQAGSTGGRKSFVDALHNAGLSDKDIRDVLGIIATSDDELDIDDPKVFAELVTAIVAFRATTNATLGDHAGQLTSLTGRTTHLEHAHGELTTRIDRLIGRLPWWGYVIAIIFGVIAGVWWNAFTFTVTSPPQLIGSVSVTMVTPSKADDLWVAFVFGTAVFFGVCWIVSQFAKQRVKVSKTSTSHTMTTSTDQTRVLDPVQAPIAQSPATRISEPQSA